MTSETAARQPRHEAPRQTRPDASMSLLADVAAHALDEGYYEAARRRGISPPGAAQRPAIGRFSATIAAVVLAAAGVLFATSWVTTRQNAAAAARDRAALLRSIESQSAVVDALRSRANDLRAEIASARDAALSTSTQGAALRAELDRLSLLTGATPVAGPGAEVTLADAPRTGDERTDALGTVYDRDLQAVVNALFASGAEAIAVGGQRLTATTAIRQAGSAILVDYRAIAAPYRIDAVGPPDLAARFLATQTAALYQTWQQVYGLRFTVTARSRLTLPAAGTIVIHYAQVLSRPGGS
ncbi:MAG: DUF881 domain-containing protein [Acidothermus cellulolyticus]|jgi:uncharacterized protein YlxW (UPF0749 family)|nr:DUF881 domain-containing protein [Acidothermus cellulolyticus]